MGTPTYVPQNHPHDTLIMLNIHKWGGGVTYFFSKTPPPPIGIG